MQILEHQKHQSTVLESKLAISNNKKNFHSSLRSGTPVSTIGDVFCESYTVFCMLFSVGSFSSSDIKGQPPLSHNGGNSFIFPYNSQLVLRWKVVLLILSLVHLIFSRSLLGLPILARYLYSTEACWSDYCTLVLQFCLKGDTIGFVSTTV